MSHIAGTLKIGDKRLIDVCFNCVFCGPRYWQVEEPGHPYTDGEILAEAIRQEAEWHGRNVRDFGSNFPVGIEPSLSFTEYKRTVTGAM